MHLLVYEESRAVGGISLQFDFSVTLSHLRLTQTHTQSGNGVALF